MELVWEMEWSAKSLEINGDAEDFVKEQATLVPLEYGDKRQMVWMAWMSENLLWRRPCALGLQIAWIVTLPSREIKKSGTR